MKLTGKVALVTGASKGIGKSIAIELAREGAIVIINYGSDDKGARATLDEILQIGTIGEKIKTDISNFEDTRKMIEYIITKYGKIDILVNNAGISKIGLFMDMTEGDWDEIVNINLKGVFNTCSNVVKHMIGRKEGNIINISSMWGQVGASCEVIYSASKGGIDAFTKALGKELAPSGIRVNAISPGVIDTEMNNNITIEEKQDLINEIPLSRMGKPKEVAKIVTFLASDAASYITSQIIRVDGGII